MSVTLSRVGDCAAAFDGPGTDDPSPLGRKVGLRSGESPMIARQFTQADVTVSGTYSGARLRVIHCYPNGTEAEVQQLVPSDNATSTFRLNFAAGVLADLKVKLGAIGSGSIAVAITPYKDGFRPTDV